MSDDAGDAVLDLAIVGGGPTGVSIAAEASRAGLEALIIEKGPLLASLLAFPRDMIFFTTRERLEIAGVPFTIPNAKPTRREAISYYHSVVRHFSLRLALHERVRSIERSEEGFLVGTRRSDTDRSYRARAVALATGYFDNPRHLDVPGEELDWVRHRYEEPYQHFGEKVVVVGGGNSAAEAALELWRGGAEVTLVHRGAALKPSVKYWLKPDFENRVAEGSLAARFDSIVHSFADHGVEVTQGGRTARLPAATAYVLIGYEPDVALQRESGVQVDHTTLVPDFDSATCESNVPGLYIVGTLQAGVDTHRIFIENSRVHSVRLVEHLARRIGRGC